jgi:hypothetical protein
MDRLWMGSSIQMYLMADLSDELTFDNDYYLMVTEVRERLCVSQREIQKAYI